MLITNGKHVITALLLTLAALNACSEPGAGDPATLSPTVEATPTVAVETPQSTVTPAPTEATQAVATPTTVLAEREIPVDIERLAMFDAAAGWAVGRPGEALGDQLLVTGDGGESWQLVTPEDVDAPGTESLPDRRVAAHFASTLRAWAAFSHPQPATETDAPRVWLTADGGQSWQASAPLEFGEVPFEYFAPSDLGSSDGQFGWLMAHLGAGMSHDYIAIFTSGDGGHSWQRVADPDNNPVIQACNKSGLVFMDAQEGWLSGNCPGLMQSLFLYHSTDGGESWSQIQLPAPEGLSGDAGDSLGDRCGIPQITLLSERVPALSLHCFDFEEETSQAWLYTAADGGVNWQAQPLPEPAGVFTFVAPGEGWYVAADESQQDENSRIYHTTDRGESWTTLAQVEGQGQAQIHFADSMNGWTAIGYPPERTLLRTTDGGATWDKLRPVTIRLEE